MKKGKKEKNRTKNLTIESKTEEMFMDSVNQKQKYCAAIIYYNSICSLYRLVDLCCFHCQIFKINSTSN